MMSFNYSLLVVVFPMINIGPITVSDMSCHIWR